MGKPIIPIIPTNHPLNLSPSPGLVPSPNPFVYEDALGMVSPFNYLPTLAQIKVVVTDLPERLGAPPFRITPHPPPFVLPPHPPPFVLPPTHPLSYYPPTPPLSYYPPPTPSVILPTPPPPVVLPPLSSASIPTLLM